MATVSIVKLKIRRGTDAERQQIILDTGELGYTTDTDLKRVFIGDGITYGGIPVSTKVFYTDLQNTQQTLIGDLIYDATTFGLYCVSAIDTDTPRPYVYSFAKLAGKVDPDNIYLNFNATNKLTIKNNSVDQTKISSSSFNQSIAGGNGTTIGVNYDNVKLIISANKLTVSEAGLNLSLLNTTTLPVVNPGPGKLWNDAGTVKVGS